MSMLSFTLKMEPEHVMCTRVVMVRFGTMYRVPCTLVCCWGTGNKRKRGGITMIGGIAFEMWLLRVN